MIFPWDSHLPTCICGRIVFSISIRYSCKCNDDLKLLSDFILVLTKPWPIYSVVYLHSHYPSQKHYIATKETGSLPIEELYEYGLQYKNQSDDQA